MKSCKEIEVCKNLFYAMGRLEKVKIIENSNLNSREKNLFIFKFVEGLTIKEIADKMQIGLDAFNKMQKRVCIKFYGWLERVASEKGNKLDIILQS